MESCRRDLFSDVVVDSFIFSNNQITLSSCSFPKTVVRILGSCHNRQKPRAPIRNRLTRKVANAKGLNRNTNLT